MSSKSETIHLGFDIGSISINTVVMDDRKNIIEERYDHCQGKPFMKLRTIMEELLECYGADRFGNLGFTGTGGKLAAELMGGHYITRSSHNPLLSAACIHGSERSSRWVEKIPS